MKDLPRNYRPSTVTRWLIEKELIKYILCGVVAFVCDFSTLVFATEVLGFHYLYSNILGYSVGLIVSYTINVRWVFSYRRFGQTSGREFVFFAVIVLLGFGVSEVVLYVATEYGNMAYTTSKVVSTFFVFLFNYVTKKLFLFSPR